MSVRLRALLVASFAVAGLVLGLGTASADEADGSGEGPSGRGSPVGDVLDTVDDLTGPLVPQEVDDLIGGLYY